MDAVDFPGRNATLYAPPGMEGAVDLPYMTTVDVSVQLPNGKPCPVVLSCWQARPEEMEEFVKNGGKFYFMVWGNTHPPIYLTPFHPCPPPEIITPNTPASPKEN